MADVNIFAKPDDQAYMPDPLEQAMTAQSTTNPWAIPHMLASQIRGDARRDQYSGDLAAFNQQALAGQQSLNADDIKMKLLEEFFKNTAGPSMQAEMLGFNPGREDIQLFDTFFREGARADVGKKNADVLNTSVQVGERPKGVEQVFGNIGYGNLESVPTPGERTEAAKGKGGVKLKTNYAPDAFGGFKYTTEEELTPEQAAERVAQAEGDEKAAAAAAAGQPAPAGGGGKPAPKAGAASVDANNPGMDTTTGDVNNPGMQSGDLNKQKTPAPNQGPIDPRNEGVPARMNNINPYQAEAFSQAMAQNKWDGKNVVPQSLRIYADASMSIDFKDATGQIVRVKVDRSGNVVK